MAQRLYKYDIAISFAGEDRDYAHQLASCLRDKGLIVFFDTYEQANILGEYLTEYLHDVYQNASNYCAVILSHAYIQARWSRHEWRSAQSRALEQDVYIFPIRLDDVVVPGLPTSMAYVSANQYSILEICDLIYQKIHSNSEINKQIRFAQRSFDQGNFVQVVSIVDDLLASNRIDNNNHVLRLKADALNMQGKDKQAISAFKELMVIQPNDSRLHYVLAGCYFRLGDYENAITEYQKCLQIEPDHYPASRELRDANRYREIKDWPFIGKMLDRIMVRHLRHKHRN